MRDLVKENDKDCIRRVICEETRASFAGDYDAWARCFVQDERAMDVSYTAGGGVIVIKGWDQISKHMQRLTEAGVANFEDELRSEIQVSVSGDLAWATFQSELPSYPGLNRRTEFEQLRILERHGDEWRIVYLGFMAKRSTHAFSVIQVDETGRVLWATSETLEALKTFEGLTLSGGRLFAADPGVQAELTRAIKRAAELRHVPDGLCIGRMEGTFYYPCILGMDQNGSVLHCTVFARDGHVNIGFNDSEFFAPKVRAAQEVFGLSKAQARLVLGLLNGQSVGEFAEASDITINTARTHLTRVYEKTGVSSQQSLVRLVLSLHTFAE